MKKVNQLPEGRVEAIHLQMIKAPQNETTTPTIVVEDPTGEAITVHFSREFDRNSIPEHVGEWYEFQNVIYFDRQNQGQRMCPNCGDALSLRDPATQRPSSFDEDSNAEEILFATNDTNITKLKSQCLLSVDEVSTDPAQWTCIACDWSSNTIDDCTYSEGGSEKDLLDRISTSLEKNTANAPDLQDSSRLEDYKLTPIRDQVRNGEVPDPAHITFEEIAAEYSFGNEAPDPTRITSIAPSVATGRTTHPLTDATERYCNVQLNPRMFDWARERPTLNLVIALDVSGSMGTPMGYSRAGTQDEQTPLRLQAASEAISSVAQRLNETDTLGVVTFNEETALVRPRSGLSQSTGESLRSRLEAITPEGNTDLLTGYKQAGELFSQNEMETGPHVENRILVISDTVPAQEAGSDGPFIEQCKTFQAQGIATSFVSLCAPAPENSRALCSVSGSNQAFVRTEAELQTLFRAGLDSLLFPIATDLTITSTIPETALTTETPSDQPAEGESLHRQTIFPDGPTEQSLTGSLFELTTAPLPEQSELQISWRDRSGERQQSVVDLSFTQAENACESETLRAKIALYRYQRVLQQWARANQNGHSSAVSGSNNTQKASEDLMFKSECVSIFKKYLQSESKKINNTNFGAEIEILDLLSNSLRE